MSVVDSRLTGRRKAAALLITIGKERSAEVLRHLNDDDIERLTWEISSMGELDAAHRREVINEFAESTEAHNIVSIGGFEFAEELLRMALGEEKATEVIDRLSATNTATPFSFLRHLSVQQLVQFLQNEHPQTIALLISYLNGERAAQVLAAMEGSIAGDVAQRIALMERAHPDIVSEVEGVLRRKLSSVLKPVRQTQNIGGIDVLVGVLKHCSRTTERTIIEGLEENEPELAEQVKKRMFVFENIAALDDRSIQRILREVEVRDLSFALKATTEVVRECILRNMSQRAAAMLKEDMDSSGPVRLRNAEEAQQRIVDVVRRLDEAEEIVIARGGDDELVG